MTLQRRRGPSIINVTYPCGSPVQQEQLALFQPTKRATRSVAGGQELHRDESGSAAVIVDDRC